MRDRLLAFASRLGFAWARRRLDDEARREMEAHIELLAERHARAGMDPQEALSAARRQFGNAALVREEIYEMNGFRPVDGLAQDLRYAFRQLRRNPVFAAVAIATLALGIGGTTAVFSAVRAVLLAPLPYDEAGQLVRLYQQEPGNPASRNYLTGVHFAELRRQAASFEHLAALFTYRDTGLDLSGPRGTERLRVLEVTAGYFDTLRTPLVRGAGFERADETGTRRVILSHDLWRTRFDSEPDVVGRAIRLSGEPYEIAGIAPPGFEDPIAGAVDAWLPYDLAGNTSEQNYSVTVIGRLRPGISLDRTRAELATLSGALAERWPRARASELAAVPLREDLVAPSRGPLRLLMVAVALVLLVACVNVANLVLVRATGRVPEFAIRSALGSGRARLVRQLLVESTVLAALGGLAGLALGRVAIALLQFAGRGVIPRLEDVQLDAAVLGFAALVTLTTVAVFGIGPALRFGSIQPGRALGRQSRSGTGTRGQARVRGALAAAQLALALTLLAGAGVLLVSFERLQRVDLGFRTDGVLTFHVSLPTARYDAQRRAAFHEELARQLRALPGVESAGGTSRLPATGRYHPWGATIESGPLAGESLGRVRPIQHRTISGDLQRALGIPLLAGRGFDTRDDADAPLRAVVSERFAHAAFPDVPLDRIPGHRFETIGGSREIIGVVGDVSLDVYGAPAPMVYHAHRQFAANRNWELTQVVAAAVPPERLVESVRSTVAALDPELAVYGVAPLEAVLGRGVGRERFALVLMGAFAAVSLVLAALGLYGVLAYGVRQRTREIGIRMALGATAAQVRGLVLRQAAVVVGTGLAAGLGGALVLGRFLSALVFETSASDPLVLLTTAVLLSAVSVLAAWLPARRAARVEPSLAIQEG